MSKFPLERSIDILVISAMLICSVISLPYVTQQEVAIHWGLDGQPNGFANKNIALFFMPLLATILSIISYFALRQASAKSGANKQRTAVALAINLVILVSLAVGHYLIISNATGVHLLTGD